MKTAQIARQRLGLRDRAPESRMARYRKRRGQKQAGQQPPIELWCAP